MSDSWLSSFKCLEIQKHESPKSKDIKKLGEFLDGFFKNKTMEDTRIVLFYSNPRHFSDQSTVSVPRDIEREYKSYINFYIENDFSDQDHWYNILKSKESNCVIYCTNDFSDLNKESRRVTSKLRSILQNEMELFDDRRLVLFSPAISLDLDHHPANEKSLLFDFLQVKAYLLWFDNDLNKHDGRSLDVHKCWCGNGLAGWLLRNQPEEPFDLSAFFMQSLDSRLEALNSYERELAEGQAYNWVASQDYLIELAKFLPPYRRNNRFVRGAFNHEDGKPIIFPNILALTMHQRHLLLDSWLTLWCAKEREELFLQPSSLALMYWVARKLNLPRARNAEEFLTLYFDLDGQQRRQEYWKEASWFGGNLSIE